MPDVPSEAKYTQVEETDENNPCSESTLQKIAGSINYILDQIDSEAVGSIIACMMTEAQIQAARGVGWIQADGRSIAGSRLALLTGMTTAPDLRGVFVRGKNNGKTGSFSNPDGELALGTYQADQFGSHRHNVNAAQNGDYASTKISTADGAAPHIKTASGGAKFNVSGTINPSLTIDPFGDSETRPDCVVVNLFIRID